MKFAAQISPLLNYYFINLDLISTSVVFYDQLLGACHIQGYLITITLYKISFFHRIGMSSVMMSSIEMSKKENFVQDLKTFLHIKNCSFSLIMGAVLEPETGSLARDILIYPVSTADQGPASILANQLLQCEQLKLSKLEGDFSTNDVIVFKQGDASFSRKKILPIIKQIFLTNL